MVVAASVVLLFVWLAHPLTQLPPLLACSEICGKNVTTFQPPEIARGHDLLMSRVVDGGTPRVVGVAGRQVSGVHKDGSSIPMLLVISRVDVEGKPFFVASMQDTRAHHQADVEEELEEGASKKNQNKRLTIRVAGAMLVVAFLQVVVFWYVVSCNVVVEHKCQCAGVSFLTTRGLWCVCVRDGDATCDSFCRFGWQTVLESSQRGSEVNTASTVHVLTNAVAFSAREAVIGDGSLWSVSAAISAASAYLLQYVWSHRWRGHCISCALIIKSFRAGLRTSVSVFALGAQVMLWTAQLVVILTKTRFSLVQWRWAPSPMVWTRAF